MKKRMKKTRLSLGLSTVLMLSALCGCGGSPKVTDLTVGIKDLTDTPDLWRQEVSMTKNLDKDGFPLPETGNITSVDASTITDFAVRLFQQNLSETQKEETAENILLSPVSVLFALSMTANGADGNTLAQMEEVLGADLSSLNAYLYQYRTSMPRGDKYKLSLANSIWFKDNPDFTVNQDFLETCAAWYDADIYKAPFDDSTVKAINSWVSRTTDKMIPEILDGISDGAVMYLINGLAFDAEWQKTYENNQIHSADFTEEDGTVYQTELMYTTEYAYIQDEFSQGFLKYYKEHKYAFAALLPNEGISVADYVRQLDGKKLAKTLSNPVDTPVRTAIPKFETEYNVNMEDIFRNLGMNDAFDLNRADFSRLGSCTDQNIFINRILHKTYISVDGQGTRAGAATAVETRAGSAMMPEIKEVYLNRPFVYMIIDCEENIPVFIGTVMSVR